MEELRGSIVTQPTYLQALVDQSDALTALWLVIATALVMMMQGGFLLLEAGSMRSKNTINVAQKNVTDMIIAGCVFLTLGSTIMFGAGSTGLFGFGGFSFSDFSHQPMLIYQFGFCAAAATIVSGAIGERMSFRAYMVISLVIAAIVYPGFGHLVWGNIIIEGNPSFLADMGFKDYAGSTVVHVVGGAAALAACWILGPRIGRFDKTGKPIEMPGHSSVLSLLGVIILAIAWIGFNAGSSKPGSAEFTQIVVNTLVAMCFGGAAALIYDAIVNPRAMLPRTSASGILGGLVAITAGCAYVDFFGAMMIGFGGGVAATLASNILLKRFNLDDPVDAIATHLVAGFFGTVALAFFILPEYLTMSRLEFAMVQLTGVSLAATWAFGIIACVMKIMTMFMDVRVSPEHEEIGLNLAEHNAAFDSEQLVSIVRDMKAAGTLVPDMGQENIGENINGQKEQDVTVIKTMVQANHEVREKLAEKETQFEDYDKVGTDWLWETDENFNLTFISKKFYKVFGEQAESLIGKSYLSFLGQVDVSIEDHLEMLKAHKDFEDVIFSVVGFDNIIRIFSISGIARFDSKERFIGYRGRSLDVTEKMKADEEILYLAHHDHLTGLLNRYSFNTQLARCIHDGTLSANGAAILSMDLDGFKAVNDSFGHQVGDKLLRILSKRITKTCGKDSLISRFGGDEFVVCLPLGPHGSSEISTICEKLLVELSEQVDVDGLQIRVGASIGTSRFPQDATLVDELIMFSDIALYEAKGEGRGQWVQFDAKMQAKLKRRKRLENDMPLAIEKREFYALFQPQVDMSERRLTGFEALIRWTHPELGELSPNEFIRIAEESGHIAQLGNFVLQEACRTAASWPKVAGSDLLISVNVSPQQFFSQDLTEVIKTAITEYQLDPTRLEIEITEGTLVRDADEAIRILTALRDLGVRIAVDDFGTGYSSLSYLQRFPLDRLKIDRAFIKEIEANPNDRRITHAIVDLGRSLGLNVIAEGVETAEQYDQLADMLCDEIQGFLVSPPVSALQSIGLIEKAISGDLKFEDHITDTNHPRYAGARVP